MIGWSTTWPLTVIILASCHMPAQCAPAHAVGGRRELFLVIPCSLHDVSDVHNAGPGPDTSQTEWVDLLYELHV